ncbi:DUF6279 family lipoprotein [Pseudomonas sp. P5_152]|uniref:DUF6279 family lipoprotein n=1 Tax=unclassified Pseudomonas TaxID=196821 RepID=UPI000BA37903|nr:MULTISPECIES: DUF6279 family lipoprotein [unclassified Pseudomonas]MDX9667460.1 DUF6279 family lipoprotein [Pseudomonas sp. P5_152]QHD00155.1 hypothetical protein PspS04_07115 [Pseudomonas sp. S04]QHF32637.1 hypothetical protein PspS19_07115 [Pseudomonas sp. S19]
MTRWLHHLSLLLSLCLALTACNRVDLAYRNLDVLIPWTLDDYLDMNSQQKDWLGTRLKQTLSWHCSTQMPGYLEWLGQLQQMVASNQVSDSALQSRTLEARQAIALTARQITPSAVELLQGMSDQQVKEMNQAFAKDLRERQDKYLKPPLAQQIRQRGARMDKRLSDWLGPLNQAQKARVVAWSTALGEQNQQWIANRAHWQAQFSAAMAQRQSADFAPRIETLLVDRESLWTPAYRQAFSDTEAQARSLLVDLMDQSTAEQRQHLVQKIEKLRSDLKALKCLKA